MSPPRLGLVLLLALLAAVSVAALDATARRDIASDDFNVSFSGGPDPGLWEVDYQSGKGEVSVVDGALRTAMSEAGHAYCSLARPFSRRNITLSVEWNHTTDGGRFLELAVLSLVGGTYVPMLGISADSGGLIFSARLDGHFEEYQTWVEAPLLTTYRLVLRIDGELANITVVDVAMDTTYWSMGDLRIDPLTDHSTVRLGVTSPNIVERPVAFWDDFELFDHVSGPNLSPVWGPLPVLRAMEDVPTSYDFSSDVSDDQEQWELSIGTESPWVKRIDGLNVTFLFPQGPVDRVVNLTLDDGYDQSVACVNFSVTPTNDPPEHTIPPTMDAVEGIPLEWDLSPYVWDVDNATEDLFIIENSPYATTDGLVLTVKFPEGMRQYSLRFMVSDGLLESGVIVTFLISATANPPEILGIGQLNVSEDVETVLELGPYVRDPDTALQDLAIATTSDQITVEGAELHMLFTEGGVLEVVTLIVSDGVSSAKRDFVVSVSSRDDPPVIGAIPLQNVIEDREGRIDLGSYITDEDTPLRSLRIACQWPRVTNVTAFNISVLYEIAIDLDTVPFNVSDGYSTVSGHFTVHVNPVNDPPRLLGIGSASPPITLTVYAGRSTTFDIKAEDEEEMTLMFLVDSPVSGLSVVANRLRIGPLSALLPPFEAMLAVVDGDGAMDSLTFTVVVLDPSGPPMAVHLVSPANFSTYEEGEPILFSVIVLFPTGIPAGPVEVKWSSTLQGSVLRLTSQTGLSANVSWLLPGEHRMTVVATSGTLTATEWFVVTVTGRETGGGDGGTGDNANAMMIGAISSILVVILITAWVTMRAYATAITVPPKPVKPPPPVLVAGPSPAPATRVDPEELYITLVDELGIAEEEVDEGASMWSIPAPSTRPTAPPAAMAKGAPAPALPRPVSVPRPAGGKEEQKARIAAVKATIEAMPGGVPRELRLFDSWTIAERVVKGKTKTAPDGTPLVNVMDGWYVDTPDDPVRFLKPWRE